MELEVEEAEGEDGGSAGDLGRRRLRRWLALAIPPGTCQDHHDFVRARILIAGCFASTAILLLALAGLEAVGIGAVSDGSPWAAAFGIALLLPIPTLRLVRSLPVAVSILCAGIGLNLVVTSFYLGGAEAAMLPTLAVLPVFAALMGGRLQGAVWSVLVLATWLLFIVAGQSGYAYPHMTDPAHLTLARAFCLIATGGTIFVAVLIYETMNRTLREELSAERSLFERMAGTDPLTQLANRRSFTQQLALGVERARRTKRKLGVYMLDLNGFKPVNDELGHPAGDHLLEAIARRLRDDVRLSDRVARVGGDEFAVIVEDALRRAEFELVAERLTEAVARPEPIRGRTVRVTCSIGVAVYPDDATEPAALVDCADMAMYRAKEHGAATIFASDLDVADAG